MTRRSLLAGVVALQIAFLLGWAGYHEGVRQAAPTIMLNVLPVDPRDILRGDYMVLSYEISRHATPPGWKGAGEEIWVALRREEDRHVIDRVVTGSSRPDASSGLWVRAEARPHPFTDGQMELIYGIEHLFVPEGRGTPRFDRLQIEASVGPSGRLQIKRAWLDGEVFP